MGRMASLIKMSTRMARLLPASCGCPPRLAWGWMNQAYKMNDKKDLATGNVFKRLEQLRKDFPRIPNLNWLYWDVYYEHGWQAEAFLRRMQEAQGWRIGSEWAYSLPTLSTWSHWASDEPYGGSENKGLNSTLIRFVQNSYRDTRSARIQCSETPTFTSTRAGQAAIRLQQVPQDSVGEKPSRPSSSSNQTSLSWKDPSGSNQADHVQEWNRGHLGAAGGVGLRRRARSRRHHHDGATVYDKGDYLLPWKDGGKARLYYYNPGNEARTWKLTKTWASQPEPQSSTSSRTPGGSQ